MAFIIIKAKAGSLFDCRLFCMNPVDFGKIDYGGES